MDDLVARLGDPSITRQTLECIERMPADETLAGYLDKLRRIARERTRYWDLATALNCLASLTQPRHYLEIGVRRGKSMAQVASNAPACDIYGIDLWISPYGGVDNPGPEYVREQVRAAGHAAALHLVSGDSRVAVPGLVTANPGLRFDIVTVDGDHTNEGAWADLCNVAPLIDAGGYLLFDDLTHPAHTLLEVWGRFQEECSDRFEFVTNAADHNGTGIARRRD